MSDTAFDYVIAGGGTAGCVLAARLSEDPDVTVCLVEAGPSDVGDDNILPLSEWMHLLDSGYDWDYPVEPQERGNSFMRHARAKVLGGCSSHNSCIAFWPPAECLDEWVEMGATGWSAAEILPLVKRLENNDAPGEHGHDGPVRLQDVPPNDPCGVAVLEAAALAGLPTVAFNRGETVHNGAGWFQINVGEDGTRMSTSHAYLHPILDTRRNLEVRTGCWVSEILFDEANNATGVRYQRPDLTGYDTVSARREVIVTAGSIDTPKLLMLSGIGPTAHLREVGIPVRVDSPGVGSNLDDHVEGLVFWEASQPMVTTSTQWWEIGLFTTVDEGTPAARSDDALRQRAVRHEYAAARLPDHRQRILLDAQRDSGPLAWHGPAAQPGLPGPAEGRPALLHRPRGLRRTDHAHRRAAGSHHRRAGAVEGLGGKGTRPWPRRDHRRRTARLHPPDPQHRLPPGGHGQDGRGHGSDGGARPAAAGQGRVPAAGGRRVGDAQTALR